MQKQGVTKGDLINTPRGNREFLGGKYQVLRVPAHCSKKETPPEVED